MQPQSGTASNGLIKFRGNKELIEDQKANDPAFADDSQNQPVITALAGHIRKAFGAAARAKQSITQELLKCRRQRDGVYEPEIAETIAAQGGSDIYMLITDVK